jgi:ABC-type transport system involved in cytochrome bd biosynthesis fused ATPase/permease subunit
VTISISGGGATYPGQDTPAVRDIDLDLEPGRRVALVGATGASKSTVAAVLCPPRTWTRRTGAR